MYSSFMSLIGRGGLQDHMIDPNPEGPVPARNDNGVYHPHGFGAHAVGNNNIAIGYPAVTTNYGAIAIGAHAEGFATNSVAVGYNSIYNPGKRIKQCHKHCKVMWSKEDECPTIQCNVILELAVWESLYKHPHYYTSWLPKGVFNMITEMIKDAEVGDWITIRKDT